MHLLSFVSLCIVSAVVMRYIILPVLKFIFLMPLEILSRNHRSAAKVLSFFVFPLFWVINLAWICYTIYWTRFYSFRAPWYTMCVYVLIGFGTAMSVFSTDREDAIPRSAWFLFPRSVWSLFWVALMMLAFFFLHPVVTI